MPGLSFSNQNQSRRPGLWWIPIVLIVLSIVLITLCVRADGGGAFAAARNAVQTVSKPIEHLCSGLSTPFKGVASIGTDDEKEQLQKENEQLRTLVSELEEYRQQNQRLLTLTQLADTYALTTVSATVVDTTSGWDRTATINKGSNDGIAVGMGVMSSCGLYGQVESVTSTTATVRLINDAHSSVSAMVQGSRARGIVKGAYDGTMTMEYVPVGSTVAEGDMVISSGEGGTYPHGILVGTVRNVEVDSSKLYYRISVEPIFNLQSCEEVLVLTGNEDSTATVIDQTLLDQIIANSRTSSSDASGAGTGSSSSSSAQSAGTPSTSDTTASAQASSQDGSSSAATGTSTAADTSSSGKSGSAGSSSSTAGAAASGGSNE